MRNIESQKNIFTGGLDLGSAPEVMPSDRYVDAQNIQLFQVEHTPVDMGTGRGVGRTVKVSNVKGHSLFLTIPDIPSYSRYIEFTFDITSFPGFIANFEYYISFNRSTNSNVNFISTSSSGGPSSARLFFENNLASEIEAAYPGEFTISTLVSGNILTLRLTQIGAADTYSAASGGIDDTPPTPIITATTNISNISTQDNLEVIGQASNANDLVLITTSSSNTNPSNSAPFNYGQIWRIDISNYDVNPSISIASNLVYNDEINLSLSHQCQVEVVRESDCITRIYWTDNYNPIRTLLIPDELPSRVAPDLLGFSPLAELPPIIHTGWGNGNLLSGVYSYAYRYVTQSGTSTPWIGHTQKINVFAAGSDYSSTFGGNIGTQSFRSVKLDLQNADSRYSAIEFAAVYYQDIDGPASDAYIFFRTENISPFISAEHFNNNKIYIPITVDEVIVPSLILARAKNIQSSENRMFVANYCESDRTGKYDTTGLSITHTIKRVYGDQYTTSGDRPWVGSDAWNSNLNSLPFTPANSGGINPNYASSQYTDYKGSLTDHFLRGYWRNETYRFGIVFKYNDGTWGPVDWIADFKFPDVRTEPLMGPNAGETAPTDEYFLRLIGAQISGIDLNELDEDGVPFRDKIEGFSIVRAERDAQVIAQGALVNSYAVQYFSGSIFKEIEVNSSFPYYAITGPPPPTQLLPLYYTPAVQATENSTTPYTPPSDGNYYMVGRPVDRPVFVFSPDLSLSITQANSLDTIQNVAVLDNNVVMNDAPYNTPSQSLMHKWYLDNGDTLLPQPQVLDSILLDEFSGAILGAYNINSTSIEYILDITGTTPLREYYYLELARYIAGRTTAVTVTGSNAATFLSDFAATASGFSQCGDNPGLFANPLYIVNIVRPKAQLYGGTSPDALAATRYIPTGHYQVVTPTGTPGDTGIYSATVYGGDCFVNIFTQRLLTYEGEPGRPSRQQRGRIMAFPCESSVNTSLRSFAAQTFSVETSPGTKGRISNSEFEEWSYSQVWSRTSNGITLIARQPNQSCTKCFPSRIIASEAKVLGELRDSYTRFLPNNILDVEPRYGEINDLKVMADSSANYLYFWQDIGFGSVPINAYNLKVDAAAVTVGVDGLYGKYNYVSERIGTQHKWSVSRGKRNFYWYDQANRGIFRFGQDGLSDISDIQSGGSIVPFLYNNSFGISGIDNPVYLGGIHSVFNDRTEEVLFTCLPSGEGASPWTLAWNEALNVWTSFFTFYPKIYIPLPGIRLVSPDPANGDRMYLHDSSTRRNLFYANSDLPDPVTLGDIEQSYVRFVVNRDNMIAKRVGHFAMDKNVCWEQVEVVSWQLKDLSGRPYVLRGTMSLLPEQAGSLQSQTNIYQPRQSKWVGPAPVGTDRWTELSGWQNNSVATPISSEQFFVKLVAQSLNLREIATCDTFYSKSLRNT